MKKVIVFSKNWIGDALFELPFFEALKKENPGIFLACAAPKRCHEILKRSSLIDELFDFDEKSSERSWFSRIRFAFSIKKKGPWDQGFLLHRSRSRAFLLYLAGVREIIGYGKKSGMFLTRKIPEPQEKLHDVEYHLTLLRRLGIRTPSSPNYRLYPFKEDQNEAERLLKDAGVTREEKYACFHLGANWPPKRWPTEHFAELARLLLEEESFRIVLTGGEPDRALLDQFNEKIRDQRIVTLIGKTSLGSLCGVFERARFLVTSDSGPMHIASALGTPVFGLFGPTDFEKTGPRGPGPKTIFSYIPEGFSVPYIGRDFPTDGWTGKIKPETVCASIQNFIQTGKTEVIRL